MQQSLSSAIQSYGIDDLVNDLFIKEFSYQIPGNVNFMAYYDNYMRKLQYMVQLPSTFQLYAHDSVDEISSMDWDFSISSVHANAPLAPLTPPNSSSELACSDDILRDYLMESQQNDTHFIQDIIREVSKNALEEEALENDGDCVSEAVPKPSSVWTTFSDEKKMLRIIYPGGKKTASRYFQSAYSRVVDLDAPKQFPSSTTEKSVVVVESSSGTDCATENSSVNRSLDCCVGSRVQSQHSPVRDALGDGKLGDGKLGDEAVNIDMDQVGNLEMNIVCFLGTRKAIQSCSYLDIDIVRDCWSEDAAIVSMLNPDVVLAYATGEQQVTTSSKLAQH